MHVTSSVREPWTHGAIISHTPIWAVGVPLSGSLGWGHFSAYPTCISDSNNFGQQNYYHWGQEDDLHNSPFLPENDLHNSPFLPFGGKDPGSLKANLPHPIFLTFSHSTIFLKISVLMSEENFIMMVHETIQS